MSQENTIYSNLAEQLPDTGGSELQKPTINYNAKNGVGIKGEMLPFATEIFKGENGVTLDLPVLARIETGIDNTSMVLVRDTTLGDGASESGLLLATVKKNGDNENKVLDSKRLDFEYHDSDQLSMEREDGALHQVVIIDKGGPDDDISLRLKAVRLHGDKEKSVGIEIAADQAVSTDTKLIRERRLKSSYRREAAKGFANGVKKLFLGVIAAKAVLDSGGLIDQIGEKFQDAATVVEEAIPLTHTHYTLDDIWSDGITFRQAPDGMLEMRQHEADGYYAQELTARNMVASIMEDLDGNKYAKVQLLAGQYAESHREDLLGAEKQEEFVQMIDGATSDKAVLEVLQQFGANYGFSVTFSSKNTTYFKAYDPAVGLDRVKSTAKTIVDSLGWLPTSLVKSAAIKSINMGMSTTNILGQGVAGDFSGHERIINIPVNLSWLAQTMYSAEGYMQGQSYDPKPALMHEFGHALTVSEYGLGAGTDGKVQHPELVTRVPEEQRTEDWKVSASFQQLFLDGVLKRPNVISAYSRSSDEEMTAEVISGVLSDRLDGIASPDEWRRFSSGANKAMLKTLYELEVDYPGITPYIVAHNKHLMGGVSINYGTNLSPEH